MEKLTDERSRDLQIILNYIAYVQRIDDVDNRYMPIIGRLRYLPQVVNPFFANGFKSMGYPTLFNHNVPQAYIESLKHIYCQIKAVNLEVPFTMLTEQNTRTFCATPDIVVK